MTENFWSNLARQRLARRRILAASAGAAAGAALLAACGGGDDSGKSSGPPKSSLIAEIADTSKQAKRGGVFKNYVDGDVAHLDLSLAQRAIESPQSHVYSRLAQPKVSVLKDWDSEFTGDLGESWEVSPDRLQWTFKLRQGVTWHNKPPVNGRALDVEDVVFSWNRFEAKGGDRSNIATAANPNAPIVSITATDSKTVVVKLKYPVAIMLPILGQYLSSHLTILPKETDTTFDIRQDMIGTGPFSLSSYQPSVGYKFKRNPSYYDKERPYVDEVDMPILTEYAQTLAQFKAGSLHTATVRPEDILTMKRDLPQLNLFQAPISTAIVQTIFGWLPAGKSPFLDERVRQAYSMAIDRDLWINTFYNVDRFGAEGLPVETRWNTSFAGSLAGPPYEGWWLDPKGKDFGANSKYFQYSVEESKKLLAAAGFANGLDLTSHVNAVGYGPDHPRQAEVMDGMAGAVGFRTKKDSIANYPGEFIPKYRDGKGNYEGWSFKLGPVYADDPLAHLMYRYYSKGGDAFFGFDVNNKSDNSGDPQLDSMLEKARGEFDTDKRKTQVHDLQRYLAKSMYGVWWPGGASGFQLAWPALKDFLAYRGDIRANNGNGFFLWLDETQAPLKKS